MRLWLSLFLDHVKPPLLLRGPLLRSPVLLRGPLLRGPDALCPRGLLILRAADLAFAPRRDELPGLRAAAAAAARDRRSDEADGEADFLHVQQRAIACQAPVAAREEMHTSIVTNRLLLLLLLGCPRALDLGE